MVSNGHLYKSYSWWTCRRGMNGLSHMIWYNRLNYTTISNCVDGRDVLGKAFFLPRNTDLRNFPHKNTCPAICKCRYSCKPAYKLLQLELQTRVKSLLRLSDQKCATYVHTQVYCSIQDFPKSIHRSCTSFSLLFLHLEIDSRSCTALCSYQHQPYIGWMHSKWIVVLLCIHLTWLGAW